MHRHVFKFYFKVHFISSANDTDLNRALKKTFEFLSNICKLNTITEKEVKWAFGILQTNSIALAAGRYVFKIGYVTKKYCFYVQSEKSTHQIFVVS